MCAQLLPIHCLWTQMQLLRQHLRQQFLLLQQLNRLKMVSLHTGLGCEIQPYFILITSKSTYRVTQEMGKPSELKRGSPQQTGAMDWRPGRWKDLWKAAVLAAQWQDIPWPHCMSAHWNLNKRVPAAQKAHLLHPLQTALRFYCKKVVCIFY